MATLGSMFAAGAYFMGGKEVAKQQGPAINAASKDEEKFIQYVGSLPRERWGGRGGGLERGEKGLTGVDRDFLKNAQAEEGKAKH